MFPSPSHWAVPGKRAVLTGTCNRFSRPACSTTSGLWVVTRILFLRLVLQHLNHSGNEVWMDVALWFLDHHDGMLFEVERDDERDDVDSAARDERGRKRSSGSIGFSQSSGATYRRSQTSSTNGNRLARAAESPVRAGICRESSAARAPDYSHPPAVPTFRQSPRPVRPDVVDGVPTPREQREGGKTDAAGSPLQKQAGGSVFSIGGRKSCSRHTLRPETARLCRTIHPSPRLRFARYSPLCMFH